MKKFLSIALLLSMLLGIFSGCQFIPTPSPTETPLDSAVAYLKNMYDQSTKNEDTKLTGDKELLPTVAIDGVFYAVSWSIEVTSGPAECIKIAAGAAAGTQKIDIVTQPEEEVRFILTGTISDADGNTATINIKFYTPAVEKVEIEDGKKVVIKIVADAKYATGTEYKYTSSSSGKSKMELNLSEKKAEAIAFTMISNTDGSVTFKTEDGYFLSCDANSVEFVTAESDFTKFILEPAEGGQYIKCAVANYNGNPQYLEVYSGYLTCYGLTESSNTDLYIFELEDATGANGTVVKEGTSTTPTEPSETTPTTPTTPSIPEGVVDPVAGTAYKFGMVQGLAGKTYFLSGGMAATYYLDTKEGMENGLDVYLENAEGGYGYYLYVMDNGAKLYINVTTSGTHVNNVYGETAETVYTYDATLKTVKVNVNGEDYIIGTRNDKTYNSVGPVKVSNNPFYCQFYGEGTVTPPATEPTEPTTPSEPSAPTVADGTYILWSVADGKAVTALSGKTYGYLPATDVVLTDGVLTGVVELNVFTVKNNGDGTFKLYDSEGKVLYMSGTYNNWNFGTDASVEGSDWTLVDAGNGTYNIKNVLKEKAFAYDSNYNTFGCYTSDHSAMALTPYAASSEPDTQPTEPEATEPAPTEPEATEPSVPSGPKTEYTISKTLNELATAAGLATSNGTVIKDKVLTMDDTITVVCAQGTAGTAPTLYYGAVRLYQNGAIMTIKADGANIKTIVLTLDTASAGKGPISVSGGTASALTNGKYTITADEGASEIVITAIGADKNSRVYVAGIEVVYEK